MQYVRFGTGLIVFAAIFIASSSIADSQQKIANTHNKTQTDQRGTDKQPISVKIITTQKSQEESEKEEKERERKVTVDKVTIGIGVVQCLLFFMQLVVFGLQAKRLQETVSEMQEAKWISRETANTGIRAAMAAEDTVELMRDNSKKQLRPYVSVTMKEHPDINSPLDMRAILIFKNCGQTPAYNVYIWEKMELAPYPAADKLFVRPAITFAHGVNILDPGAEREVVCYRRPLIKENWEGIVGKGNKLYVWGEVTYSDIFNVDRRRKFRLIMAGEQMVRTGTLHWCQFGNYEEEYKTKEPNHDLGSEYEENFEEEVVE